MHSLFERVKELFTDAKLAPFARIAACRYCSDLLAAQGMLTAAVWLREHAQEIRNGLEPAKRPGRPTRPIWAMADDEDSADTQVMHVTPD